MKAFTIFLILLVMCCTLYPTVAPEDIADNMIGKDGFLPWIMTVVTRLCNHVMNLFVDPVNGFKEILGDIMLGFEKYIFKPIENILSNIFPGYVTHDDRVN